MQKQDTVFTIMILRFYTPFSCFGVDVVEEQMFMLAPRKNTLHKVRMVMVAINTQCVWGGHNDHILGGILTVPEQSIWETNILH